MQRRPPAQPTCARIAPPDSRAIALSPRCSGRPYPSSSMACTSAPFSTSAFTSSTRPISDDWCSAILLHSQHVPALHQPSIKHRSSHLAHKKTKAFANDAAADRTLGRPWHARRQGARPTLTAPSPSPHGRSEALGPAPFGCRADKHPLEHHVPTLHHPTHMQGASPTM